MKSNLLIVIDGPSSSGKTSISKILAKKFNYNCLNSGLLYRGIAYKMFSLNITVINKKIERIVDNIDFKFKKEGKNINLLLDDLNITKKIETPEISMLASKISKLNYVRNFLLKYQQDIGKNKRLIAEGRDMGTVVFPYADFKFFLTADIKKRTERRFKQYKHKIHQTLKQIELEIYKRDYYDMTRDVAPLRISCNSIIIDSTNMSLAEVIDIMITKINLNFF